MQHVLVQCCNQCATVARLEYQVSGDGDGVEYLVETNHRFDGTAQQLSVVFVHPVLGPDQRR